MIDGVVLSISPCKEMAHIWCVLSDEPLCLAYRDDFPELWPALQVGARVQLKVKPVGTMIKAVDVKLFAPVRV